MSQPSTNPTTMPRGLCLHADDNVLVVLADVAPGPVEVFGIGTGVAVEAIERIAQGHKLALRPIDAGEPVLKCGVTIGLASEPIAAGAWVHTHNCRSRFDERSHTLDRHTGAPTDTSYE